MDQAEIDATIRQRLEAANKLALELCKDSPFELDGNVSAKGNDAGDVAMSMALRRRSDGLRHYTAARLHIRDTPIGPYTVSEESVLHGVRTGIAYAIAATTGKVASRIVGKATVRKHVHGVVWNGQKENRTCLDVPVKLAALLNRGLHIKAGGETGVCASINYDTGEVQAVGLAKLAKGARVRLEFEALVPESSTET